MFGSSFASSLPSAASPGGAPSASSGAGKPAFGASIQPKKSSAAPALPFAGFASGSKLAPSGASSQSSSSVGGGGGFNFGGGSSAAKPSASPATGFGGGLDKTSPPAAGAATAAPKSSAALPFAGFGGGNGPSPPKGSTAFSIGASAAAAATSSTALVPAPSTQITSAADSHIPPPARSQRSASVDHSCISSDGRSFHSYLFDATLGQHAIVSEVAPFGDASLGGGTPRNEGGGAASSLTITTALPEGVAEALDVDPVVGLICVDASGGGNNARGNRRPREAGEKSTATLPWMCLYTRASAFLLSIAYPANDDDLDDDDDGQQQREGTVLHLLEPFERPLLRAPRGSAILRVRPAPASHAVFQRRGAMALLLREGGKEEDMGHAVVLYHGLPDSVAGGAGRGRELGGRNYPTAGTAEGAVTTPLRFGREDLVRGREDTIDAENEAYTASSRGDAPTSAATASQRVVDFCFLGAGGLASASILVLSADGAIYAASPVLFDGTVLPRAAVVGAIARLDAEMDAAAAHLRSLPATPVPTPEQERLEARARQCRAARRYWSDAFGIPAGVAGASEHAGPGSYYARAAVVHPPRSQSAAAGEGGPSRAPAWRSRLQGPLVRPPPLEAGAAPPPPCARIEPFGGAAGKGLVDGFAVAREGNAGGGPVRVEFGILPGEGAVILPRFEFETDADCRRIDEMVRGAGAYVERASIANDDGGRAEEAEERTAASASSFGRECSMVVDPLDDTMIHVLTPSQIATVTTDAVAVTANCFKARMDGATSATGGERPEMASVRTKVWSALEINASKATLSGARVSSDVHLGHILLARVSNGEMEAVNVTAAQCLYETSEHMKSKAEQLDASEGDDEALELLRRVQPLHELLQPLIDRVCEGLSKMGKIVGGATLPKDAGPETLAVFIETQRSCEANVLHPMEEMAKLLHARRDLLQEMFAHQSAELARLTASLDECKRQYESNRKRLAELESTAAVLAERSSAVLTATRDLRPQITDAEAAYFQDLKRYETSCNKWEGAVDQLRNDAGASCEAISAGAVEGGDARCLVDMPPEKVEVCHQLLRGEGQMIKQLEQKVKESGAIVTRLSRSLLGGDKENQGR
ncbi:hypothetical protein ACHAXT_006725 [Thalassiosira profunda]